MSVQETGTGLQMRSRAESWTKTVIFILYFCAHLGNATAEPLATPHTTSEEAPRIALTTILPGRSLYSAFGHSAIRVSYPNGGPDLLYNYGLSAKPFDLRFALGMLVGNMPFMAARLRTADAYEFYSQVEDRTIVEQVLAFGREETTAIIAALEEMIEALDPESPEFRAAVHLLRPDGMGSTFKVLVQHKGMDAPKLDGLTYKPFFGAALTTNQAHGERCTAREPRPSACLPPLASNLRG